MSMRTWVEILIGLVVGFAALLGADVLAERLTYGRPRRTSLWLILVAVWSAGLIVGAVAVAVDQ